MPQKEAREKKPNHCGRGNPPVLLPAAHIISVFCFKQLLLKTLNYSVKQTLKQLDCATP